VRRFTALGTKQEFRLPSVRERQKKKKNTFAAVPKTYPDTRGARTKGRLSMSHRR